MKFLDKKNFLVGYIICVVLFYGLSYVIISLFLSRDKPMAILPSVPANTFSPLMPSESSTDFLGDISAEAAVLMDAKSGAVLYCRDENKALPMASTTKIMTALIILQDLDLDTVVTVPKEATLVEGSSIYLRENEKITVETLLYGLLLESGNDAAHTLAIAHSGSIEDFAAVMNSKGKQLGLQSTSFANPHGLTAENHYTTAYELAYITRKAMENDTFKEIVSTRKKIIPSLDGELTRYFSNHNRMLGIYDGAIGVKTGYTEAAGRCLVSAAERNGEIYIVVTLNDRNDWADHKALLDYAFDNYDSVEISPKDGFSTYIGGKRISCKEAVYLTVPFGERPIIDYRITSDKQSGTGTVSYYVNGNEYGKFYLS